MRADLPVRCPERRAFGDGKGGGIMSGTKSQYDIAVIGGGPGGIVAATHAARQGRNVCLVDRKKKPGYPVRCGEAIGLKGFSSVVELNPSWIMSTITSMILVSPSGIRVTVPNDYGAYIIDRAKMESDITDDAVKAGVTFLSDTSIVSVVKQDGGRYLCSSATTQLSAACVILAEGIESRLARQLGWSTALAPDDIHSCAFARVVHKDIIPDTCVFYLGNAYAPGGYVWVFHRGGNVANVGLGVLGSHCSSGLPKKLLLSFVNSRYPGAGVSELHCGGVPMGKWIKPLVREGVMLVGDAGHMVNCVSGAGIAYALFSGKTAGTVAAKAFENGTCRHEKLKEYERKWASHYGKQQLRSVSVKEVMVGFTDPFMDDMARSVTRSKNGKMNILRIFLRAFAKHPFHLLKVIRLLR
jgi:digeranylgeranylglycerophospholipid reductase